MKRPVMAKIAMGERREGVTRRMAALTETSERTSAVYLGFGSEALFPGIEYPLVNLVCRTVSVGTVEVQSAGQVVAIPRPPLPQI